MKCALVQRHLGALIDGELDPATLVEFDRHVAGCADCQELIAFERMVRQSLREAAVADDVAPESLAERIRLSLGDAVPRGSTSERPMFRVVPVPLHQMIPLAAAAAVVLVFFGSAGVTPDDDQVSAAGMPIFRDVVRVHSSRLPADVRVDTGTGTDTDTGMGPENRSGHAPGVMSARFAASRGIGAGSRRFARAIPQLQSFFQGKVEFPVRPASFERQDVQLVGARVSNVRERPAAALYYQVNGRRVTVVMFRSMPGVAQRRVRVGDHEIAMGSADGYSVPIRQHDGISYAFTGDLTRQELMELAASAHVSY